MAVFFPEDTNGKGSRQVVLLDAKGKNTAEMLITDTLVIGSNDNIIAAANSTLNGPGATMKVDGGSFTVNGRFNLGANNDGYIILFSTLEDKL